MLLLGIMIGVWVGVPLGVLLIAMLGPRQEGSGRSDTRSMQDLLARHFPSAAAAAPAENVPKFVDETAPDRRLAR
jgi:hypothetical protein